MTEQQRFDAKYVVDAESGCWLWTASIGTAGYGQFKVGRSTPGAHRVSYRLHVSPVPAGLYVLHTCDVRRCVNPAHLYLGTPQDNMDDKLRRSRHRALRGEAHPCAKLTTRDALAILAELSTPNQPHSGRYRQGLRYFWVFGVVYKAWPILGAPDQTGGHMSKTIERAANAYLHYVTNNPAFTESFEAILVKTYGDRVPPGARAKALALAKELVEDAKGGNGRCPCGKELGPRQTKFCSRKHQGLYGNTGGTGRPRTVTAEDREKMCELYISGASIDAIMAMCQRARRTVKRALNDAGIELRKNGGRKKFCPSCGKQIKRDHYETAYHYQRRRYCHSQVCKNEGRKKGLAQYRT